MQKKLKLPKNYLLRDREGAEEELGTGERHPDLLLKYSQLRGASEARPSLEALMVCPKQKINTVSATLWSA